jgi:anion-transporting  ArsA/GET3 family ATPase
VSAKPWLEHRILVTVGTGGVGKTTVGAAIGLEAARRGKRALVVTIDPARRLADALGVGELGHEPRTLPRKVLRKAGIEGRGELVAMMLDTKRTFDELVSRYSPDEEALERILANPIYQNLTDALAGSREYSAMEKLHQLHSAGDYDLIVLDTPPSTHALEFLDAPRRLTGFLQSDFLKLLFRPALAMGRTGFRLFRFGSATVLRAMERLTGIGFLRTISDFLLAFESMLEGFTTRAAEIEAAALWISRHACRRTELACWAS